MLRAVAVVRAGSWEPISARDRIVLAADERFRRRSRMITSGGIEFMLDLADAVILNDGDAIALEDGGSIRVEAAPEALVEVTADDPATLARLAFHIGNRHVPAEILGDRIRIRDDRVIVALLRRMGARVRRRRMPFHPEAGALAGHGHG
jgi:urease accessory protein